MLLFFIIAGTLLVIGILFFIISLHKNTGSFMQINRLLEQGNRTKAKNLLSTRVSTTHNNPQAQWLLAQLHYQDAEFDYALVQGRALLRNTSLPPEIDIKKVHALLVNSYIKKEQWDNALTELKTIQEKLGADWELMKNFGEILICKHEYSEALKYLGHADQLKKNDSDILARLAECYYYLGQIDKARSILETVIQLDKKNGLAHFLLAEIYKNNKSWDGAINMYRTALHTPRYKLHAFYGIGYAYSKKDMYTNAITVLSEGLEYVEHRIHSAREERLASTPIVLEMRYLLATAYLQDKDYQGAIDQWYEISNINPDYKNVKALLQENKRRGKDRIQDYLIAKDLEFNKISKHIIESLEYTILNYSNIDKETIVAECQTKDIKLNKLHNVLIVLKRQLTPIGERQVIDAERIMQRYSAQEMILISPIGIAPTAMRYALKKPIQFVGKNQVMRYIKHYEKMRGQ